MYACTCAQILYEWLYVKERTEYELKVSFSFIFIISVIQIGGSDAVCLKDSL